MWIEIMACASRHFYHHILLIFFFSQILLFSMNSFCSPYFSPTAASSATVSGPYCSASGYRCIQVGLLIESNFNSHMLKFLLVDFSKLKTHIN